jgi:hypothetical protein
MEKIKQKDNYKTKVVFRKFKNGEIIALFPYEIINRKWNCNSYMHLGQHGEADYHGLITVAKLAKENEYIELKNELESIGYNLDIVEKVNYKKI